MGDDLDRLLAACDQAGDVLQLKFSSGVAGGQEALHDGMLNEKEGEVRSCLETGNQPAFTPRRCTRAVPARGGNVYYSTKRYVWRGVLWRSNQDVRDIFPPSQLKQQQQQPPKSPRRKRQEGPSKTAPGSRRKGGMC